MLTCTLAVKAFAGGLLGLPERDRAIVVATTVDLNRASLAELQVLPGIGRTRAEAIILHRLRHGPFRRLEDLSGVDGLGGSAIERLRSMVRLR